MALRTLPPKPARYRRHRTIFMVLQWIYFPFTTLLYNSLAAFNSQTRLMFKWYLTKFDFTEKAVVSGTTKATTVTRSSAAVIGLILDACGRVKALQGAQGGPG